MTQYIVKKTLAGNNVVYIPVPGIDNAYVALSSKIANRDQPVEQTNTRQVITFFLVGESSTVEWEPSSGPIQTVTPTPAGSKAHRPYDVWYGCACNVSWGQSVVDEIGLPEDFIKGDLVSLFDKLARFL